MAELRPLKDQSIADLQLLNPVIQWCLVRVDTCTRRRCFLAVTPDSERSAEPSEGIYSLEGLRKAQTLRSEAWTSSETVLDLNTGLLIAMWQITVIPSLHFWVFTDELRDGVEQLCIPGELWTARTGGAGTLICRKDMLAVSAFLMRSLLPTSGSDRCSFGKEEGG